MPWDYLELFAFVKRPGMYLGRNDIDLAYAFLVGYETALRGKVDFTRQFSSHLFSKYAGIREMVELKENLNYFTLVEQINRLAELEEKDAMEIFSKEGCEFLVFHSDDLNENGFKKSAIKALKRALDLEISANHASNDTTFYGSYITQLGKRIKEWPGTRLEPKHMIALEWIERENSERLLKWSEREEEFQDDRSQELRLIKDLRRSLTMEFIDEFQKD